MNTKKQTTKNNPYNGLSPDSQLSAWNKFTDWLGITNNRGTLQYQQDLYSNQWESQNALALADRQYNSPSNQAQLMREAGLNPDFQNIGVGSSSLSSANANSASAPLVNEANSFGNFLANAFDIALRVASGVVSLEQSAFAQDMQLLPDVLQSTKRNIISSFGVEGYDSEGGVKSLLDYISQPNVDIANMLKIKEFPTNFRTKRATKIMNRYLDEYVRSEDIKKDILENIRSKTKIQMDAAEQVAKKEVYENNSTSDNFTEISKLLAKYQYEILKLNLDLSQEQTSNSLEFEQGRDVQLEVKAHNAANAEGAAHSESVTTLKSIERDFIKDLKTKADDGNSLATAILGLLSAATHFSGSSSSSFDSTGRKSSSSSINFSF